jgi:hypothetical protein
MKKIADEHAAALKKEQAAAEANKLASAKYWREQIVKAESALIEEPPVNRWVKAVYDAAQKRIKSRAAKKASEALLYESFGEVKSHGSVN